MNYKLLVFLAAGGIMVGCSKKEADVIPPQHVSETTTAPAPATTAAAALQNAAQSSVTNVQAAAQSAMTNAQAAIASASTNITATAGNLVNNVTNSVQIPPTAATNSAVQNALTTLGGFVKPSTDAAAPAVTIPSSTPAPAQTVTPMSLADISTDQVTQALKEALGKGLQHAVASLGQPGGFLTNLSVKIPLPDKLQSTEKALRALGQGQLADQCITTMNQAAEQAVPAAADVFVAGLKNMSVDDAKGILNGAPDAATQYFRRTTETQLTEKFTPIVQQAMMKCGATAAYEQVLDKAKMASPFFKNPSLDLNAYVTGKAMDGLFKMVADEEKTIRENPVARSTDVLKSVFGALQK